MQGFSKDMENLKKNQSLVESLINRLDQIEGRISGLEHLDNDKDKKKNTNRTYRPLSHH
jgi:hypothetical protein